MCGICSDVLHYHCMDSVCSVVTCNIIVEVIHIILSTYIHNSYSLAILCHTKYSDSLCESLTQLYCTTHSTCIHYMYSSLMPIIIFDSESHSPTIICIPLYMYLHFSLHGGTRQATLILHVL